MILINFISMTLSLKPIYLIPGFGQSPIYSTVTEPNLYPECPSDLNRITIRSATSYNTDFFYEYPNCFAKLFQVYLNETTGNVEQLPGIITDSSQIGSTSELPADYTAIISELTKIGYKDNVDLFSVGYNYYLHPVTSFSVYDELKEKIEEIYNSTHEKAIIISFDQGTSFTSIFLSNYSSSEWSKEYIDRVIFLAPTFAGIPIFQELYTQRIDSVPNSDEMKKTISMMPGLHIMLPNYHVFQNRTIIYNLYTNFDQYNASYSFEFLKLQGKVDEESESVFQACVEKYLKEPVPEPPVPSLIIYNDGTTQNVSYVINHQSNTVTSIYKSPGDGVVASEGAEYACKNWDSSICKNLHNSIKHDQITSTETVIQYIINYIQSNDDENSVKNHALFLASGFNGSPLYATITDATKATMCPPNLNNYLIYTTFVENMYRFIDDSDTLSWLNDDCISYITNTQLNEKKNGITFSDGVLLKSSKFGEYNHLSGFDGIITQLSKYGHTHYKDLFGVGYNYIHFPFLNDETYKELKENIEKYYTKTGQKSILAGFDQGANFIENFITDYVSANWAQQYVSAVIFYAPYFAGSGTYDRLTTGTFGNDFPTKYTTSMPGLHVMMPNEAVFGNKAVILDFPKDRDYSNSSYASDLLVQLGKIDETSRSILALTDKYRKIIPKEPPVPSLIIYNDKVNTGSGYNYYPKTNSVSSFSGKGDGTLNSDGAEYACKNWEKSICFNHNDPSLIHQNIPSNDETVNLTTLYIDQIQKGKSLPINKTVIMTPLSGSYTDQSYFNSHNIDSSRFNYSCNAGHVGNYKFSNAFDNNKGTYWISDTPNSDDFKNTITIEFNTVYSLNAILYDPSYFTRNGIRDFQGFPSRMNVYSSKNGKDYQLEAVFLGTPVYPWTTVQLLFPSPIICDKLKLEYDEVTHQNFSPPESFTPIIGNLFFMKSGDYDIIRMKNLDSSFPNQEFLDDMCISTEHFSFLPNGASKRKYPIKNAFSNDDNYWISDKPNTDDFKNNIIVTFKEKTVFDSFLFDAYYLAKDKSFQGFPDVLNFYISVDGEEFKMNSQFIANISEYKNKRMKCTLFNPVICNKVKLEFYSVTGQTITSSANYTNPVISNIKFYKENRIEFNTFESPSGYYTSNEYINAHMILPSFFTATTNGGEKNDRPFTNCFDNNDKTYWYSNTPNTDDFKNEILVDFRETVKLSSIIIDSAFYTNKSTNPYTRKYDGFPTDLRLYASEGNYSVELIAVFTGNPAYPLSRAVFPLKEPVACKSIKLVFHSVTDINDDKTLRPALGNLFFMKEETYSTSSFTGTNGNYANNNYVNLHTILFDEFKATNNDGEQSGKPFSNAFDNISSTYFHGDKDNTDTFHTLITLAFNNPVKVEGFLYDNSYHTNWQAQTRYFDGFPQTLLIYKSLGDGNTELVHVFKGTPVYPMARIQFIFPKPVLCDKLKLEYYDVTKYYETQRSYAVTGGLTFLHHYTSNYQSLSYKGSEGNYVNAAYKTKHQILTSEFTYAANGGSKSGKDISNAFDNAGNTYWYSGKVNSNSFKNTLTTTFKINTSIKAFLFDTSYHTTGTSRSFDGFPTKLYVLYRKGNNPFELAAVFTGFPVYPWKQIQLVLDQPIYCDQLKLVFYDVTPDEGGSLNPVIGNLFFYRSGINFQGVSGNYINNDYITKHQIIQSLFTPSMNGGEKSIYPFSNLFDDNSQTYYVSDIENNETFKNTVTIEFKSTHYLDAILYDTAYGTKDQVRTFYGFPTIFTIYKSVGNNKFEVAQIFEGFPVYPMTKIQFVFDSPIFCDKIKLEYTEVTLSKMANIPDGYNLNSGGFTFLQYEEMTPIPDPTSIPTMTPTLSQSETPSQSPTRSPEMTPLPSSSKSPSISPTPSPSNSPMMTPSKSSTESLSMSSIPSLSPIPVTDVITEAPTESESFYESDYLTETMIIQPELSMTETNEIDSTPIITESETPTLSITKPIPDPTETETPSKTPSETETPSKTPTETATQSPTKSPTMLPTPVEFLCEKMDHCTVESNQTNPLTVNVESSSFANQTATTNGGAIHIINAGIKCKGISFINCSSEKGGGGGIFINNTYDINTDITLEHIMFSECKAEFGSAVYLNSNSFISKITIRFCNFTANSASSDEYVNQYKYGGSAIFISARKGIISDCFFSNNKGDGGSLKIHNHFNKNNDDPLSILLQNEADFVVSNCIFDIEKDSKCSIYYFRGDKGSYYELSDCEFTGNLSHRARYIFGNAISIDSPKLHVSNCKFDATYEKSINRLNNYLLINPNEQIFRNIVVEVDNSRKLSKNTWALIAAVVGVACILVILSIVLLLVIIIGKKKIRDKKLGLDKKNTH